MMVVLGGTLAAVPISVAGASTHKAHKNVKAKTHSLKPGTVPACSKISAITINAALGTHVTSATGKAGTGTLKHVETCTYAGGAGVSIYYDAGISLQTFQEALSSLSGSAAVKGVGKSAYSSQSSNTDPNQYQVAGLFGSLEIAVTADASVANESALLKTIDSKI